MSAQERIERFDALYRLLGRLPQLGAGRFGCAEDPELFFPVSEHAERQIAAAKRVCRSCPVQGSCLQFALRAGEDEGIWGGLTPAERRRVRQTRITAGQDASEGVAA